MSEAMDAIVALRRENDLLRARLADLEVSNTDTSLLPPVVAFGLTPKLARRGIAIDTICSVGWRLSPEAKGLARALLDEAAAA